ncbi:MAG TPA: ABC transporter ATP-binding protein [Elusimicrobiales bacterium]|mgnify:FL=1|nr:ABC transporter ATP-binding protein [Elusimicrobiales bacterium]
MKKLFIKIMSITGDKKLEFLSLILFSLLVGSVMTALNPIVIKYMFDEGIIKKNFGFFILISVSFILLATITRFFELFYVLRMKKLKNYCSKKSFLNLINKYYRIPYYEIQKKESGYYTGRVYDETLTAVSSSFDIFSDILSDFLNAIVALIIVIGISIKTTFYLILVVPVVFYLSLKYQNKIKEYSKREKETESELRGFVNSMLNSYKTVRIFNLFEKIKNIVDYKFEDYNNSVYQNTKAINSFKTFSSIFFSYIEIFVVIACGYEMLKGRMSFGGFVAFMNAFWLCLNNISSVIKKLPEVTKINSNLERLSELENITETNNWHIKEEEIKLIDISVKFKEHIVLEKINLEAKKGEKILMLGENGSGKTTIANIICGFEKPNFGKVCGFEADKISACIMPFNFLPLTLKEQIDMISQNERYINSLLKDFNLENLLSKNPRSFSEGEKKKAAVMITLLKDAEVYIFDEPLANLDIRSKETVMKKIFERTASKILIAILHGEERYFKSFDKIFNIKDKKITNQTH